jgi:ABC-2 type transport system ATP-binding protein
MSIIEARNLSKAFGKKVAVSGISFTVDEGEIFGFLGPNGAGKTTTIRMLTTLIRPSEGTASVAGFDIVREARKVRNVIGFVPQEWCIYSDLSVRENLEFVAGLYGRGEDEIPHLLGIVGLSDREHDLAGDLSGGLKQRLSVAMGFVHHPKILFLDEPSAGIDPQARRSLWRIIKDLNREGTSIIFSTHHIDEADALCDRVAIIDSGTIVALDSPENLKARSSAVNIELKVDAIGPETEKFLEKVADNFKVEKRSIRIKTSSKHTKEVLDHLSERGANMDSLNVTSASLEDVFVQLTGKGIE